MTPKPVRVRLISDETLIVSYKSRDGVLDTHGRFEVPDCGVAKVVDDGAEDIIGKQRS